MRDFTILVYDERYSVPTLRIVEVKDEDKAADLAIAIFQESPHHTAIDVWLDDTRFFHVGAPTVTSLASVEQAMTITPPVRPGS
jgi:hypothetical protein